MAKEVIIYSKQNENLVNITGVTTEDDQIIMQGKLMGAWESTMYVPPESVISTIKLFLKAKLLWYIICLPFFLNRTKRTIQEDN